jgi:hypothetical protein
VSVFLDPAGDSVAEFLAVTVAAALITPFLDRVVANFCGTMPCSVPARGAAFVLDAQVEIVGDTASNSTPDVPDHEGIEAVIVPARIVARQSVPEARPGRSHLVLIGGAAGALGGGLEHQFMERADDLLARDRVTPLCGSNDVGRYRGIQVVAPVMFVQLLTAAVGYRGGTFGRLFGPRLGANMLNSCSGRSEIEL